MPQLPAIGEEVIAAGGPLVAGNIDLSARPRVKNPDGSTSTVRSMSFEQDGKEVLVPTVVNGRVVSDDEAIAHYKQTGQHLGIFATPAAATAFAEQLHASEARKLELPPIGGEVSQPAADFHATNEPPSPSLWERANTPLIPQIAAAADAIADHLDKPRLDRSELEARLEGFIAGATQGGGRVLGGFTSPLGLALTVAGLGPSGAAARSIPMVGRVLALPTVQALQTAVRVGAGGAMAAHGGHRIATAADAGDVGQGVTELAAGALGMAPLGRAVATVPRPSGPQLVKGAITAGKLIKSPVRTTIGIIADELARRTEPAPPSDVSPPGVERYKPNVSGYEPPPVDVVPAPAVAAAAPVEAPLVPAPPASTNTLPDQKALNEARLAEIRAAYQEKLRAAAAAPPPPAGEPIVAASGKMKLTGPEMVEFNRLKRTGLSLSDAYARLMDMRTLAAKLGGATPEQMAADMAHRRYKS